MKRWFVSGSVLLVATAGGPAAADHHPRIVNMGVPPGAALSRANAVSADGTTVAGRSDLGAFRWRGVGEWDVIGRGPGAWSTVVTGISGEGSVVVGYDTEFEYRWGFRWTAATGFERLLEHGWGSTVVYDVNGSGDVMVGGVSTFHVPTHAARWTPAGMDVLTQQRLAHAVSADGTVIVGGSAWRWTEPTGIEFLPVPAGATACDVRIISPDGNTFGGGCRIGSEGWPVIWTASGVEELPRLPGGDHHGVTAISDAGEIVGVVQIQQEPRAVIWTGGNIYYLAEYLHALGVNVNGWDLTGAEDITPAGDVIVGRGMFNGMERGWVATLSGCYANCDGSTVEPVLTVDDFTCFINAFAEASALPHEEQLTHYANCDHSTSAPVLTVNDFTCFINAFAAGCP